MPRLELYRFRFRDPRTGKWIRARYVAERHVIAERYAESDIVCPPEIRDVDPNERYFNPHRDERRADRTSVCNVGAIIAVARSLDCCGIVVAGVAV